MLDLQLLSNLPSNPATGRLIAPFIFVAITNKSPKGEDCRIFLTHDLDLPVFRPNLPEVLPMERFAFQDQLGDFVKGLVGIRLMEDGSDFSLRGVYCPEVTFGNYQVGIQIIDIARNCDAAVDTSLKEKGTWVYLQTLKEEARSTSNVFSVFLHSALFFLS